VLQLLVAGLEMTVNGGAESGGVLKVNKVGEVGANETQPINLPKTLWPQTASTVSAQRMATKPGPPRSSNSRRGNKRRKELSA